jgi:hypothetical protein
MKKLRILPLFLLGCTLFITRNVNAQTTSICTGAGVSCRVTTTVNGIVYEVISEKDKDKAAVIIKNQ